MKPHNAHLLLKHSLRQQGARKNDVDKRFSVRINSVYDIFFRIGKSKK